MIPLGFSGSIIVNNTSVITGTFRAMQVLTNATFTTFTAQDFTANGTVTAVTGAALGTLAAGTIIYGAITNVTLATGAVVLYK